MTDNLMELNGHKASISYDSELDAFRGEILGLNGGADFYGSSIGELRRELKTSLEVYREVYTELLNRNKDLEEQMLRNTVISVDDLYSRAGFERPSMASQLNHEPTQAMNGEERKNPSNKKFVAAISFVHDLHREESMAILRFVNAPTKEEAITILEGTDWEAEFPEYIQDGVDDIQEITP